MTECNFKLRMNRDEHPTFTASFGRDGFFVEMGPFCGQSWCKGDCGFPALTLTVDPKVNPYEMKAFGVMVACGPVFNNFRVGWTGAKISVPEEAGDPEIMRKMMWW
jgi:hypothetical protein